MKISIEAVSFQEFKEKIAALAKEFGLLEDAKQMPLPIATETPSEKKKSGRPAKKEQAEQEAAPIAMEAKSEVSGATKQEAEDAVREVLAQKDVSTARAILKAFGAGKVSELKPADYGPLVVECKKVLN